MNMSILKDLLQVCLMLELIFMGQNTGLASLSKPCILFYCYSSRSSQCSTTGVTKAVVCAILSVGWCI